MKNQEMQLPEGWKLKEINNVCDEIYRYPTYFGIDYVDSGIPEIRGELINSDGTITKDSSRYRFISKETSKKFPKTILKENDMVMTVRGTLGKIGIIPKSLEGANMTANLMRISPTRKLCEPLYLYNFFNSNLFLNKLFEHSTRGGVRTIKASKLKSIKIPIPSLETQIKINKKIDCIFMNFNSKQIQIVELQEKIKNSINILKTESDRTVLQLFIPNNVPSNWTTKKLGELAKVGQGGTPSRFNSSYWNGSIPWIKSGEILNKKIFNSRESITKEGFHSKFSKLLPKKTILMAMTGQGKTRGRTALLEIEATCNQSCAHIINKSDDILTLFLWEFLSSRYWFIRTVRYGGGQPGINTTLLKNLKISYPSTSEQRILLDNIEKMRHTLPTWYAHFEKILEEINNNIKFLEYAPKQILNDMFSGKIIK
jgi:type I restriction enzyme, S subunit